ncbi:MAG: SDR family oxidoreductase [Planctomycetales bacterium]|nr:SDR family oxidoreductase [Planctomycetales bacterium]
MPESPQLPPFASAEDRDAPRPDIRAVGWTVVTGSSSGIGRATAERLAKGGAKIVVHGRRGDAAEATAELVRAAGGQAVVELGDVADPASRQSLVDRVFRHGRIAAWVNMAGADVLTGPAATIPFTEKLSLLWRTDVEGTIDLSRAAGKRMADCGGGAIVNIGWDQAEQGMEGDSGEMFSAVKGAIACFTRSLAKSLAPHVRVNCVAPGWIRTSWGSGASDYWTARARGESLRDRWGEPSDVASAIAWLVSDDADFINGCVIPVNGGWRGWSARRSDDA